MSVSYGGDSITFADGSVQSGGWTGMKNRIINGAMVIDQRNAGASVTTAAAYTLDRYYFAEDTDGTMSVQQVSDAPEGFNNSIKFTVGTADASLAAAQYAYFRQPVEGYNFADCNFGTANAKTVTVSFWVKSSVTGLFSGNLASTGHDRCYAFSYTINSANTWEYKTATITGDTTGTWNKTNSVGVWLHFCLASGSTYLQSAGSWAAGTYLGVTGTTNLMATSGNTFQVTGVQLERGSTASSFEYRPYGTELALCQRYYVQSNSAGSGAQFMDITGRFTATTQATYTIALPVTMRSQPAVSISPAYNFSGGWYANLAGITNYAWTSAPTASTSFLLNNLTFYVSCSTITSTYVGLWTDPYCPTTASVNYFAITAEL